MEVAVQKMDPILSPFGTKSEADAYDNWFAEKVEQGLRSPIVSHDEAIARLNALREEILEQQSAAG